MAAIIIRQAAPADLSNVVNHYGSCDTPWDPFGDLSKLSNIPIEGLLIAEIDNQYAGFLYYFAGENPWFDPGTKRYAYITEVHVLEKYQGQSVGRKLLTYAVEQLKGKVNPVFISTTEGNTVARHLYESAGFRPFSRSIHYKLDYQ